jgi:hypothetical protein
MIFELHCDVLQRGRVFAGVMSTKQQSTPGWQHRTEIRASATPVASISGRQGSWGQYGSHVHVLLIGFVLPMQPLPHHRTSPDVGNSPFAESRSRFFTLTFRVVRGESGLKQTRFPTQDSCREWMRFILGTMPAKNDPEGAR